MDFQTPVPVSRQQPEINYHSGILLMGSCFVEHIGAKFDHYQVRNLTNPYGVIFNPLSITRLLERAVSRQYFKEEDLFFANGRWHSYELHSQCSLADKSLLLERLNSTLKLLRETLSSATHVVLTLGTAWVYRHIESDMVVANCHKQPQRLFTKELLDVQEIRLQLEKADHLIKGINSQCHVISTISPVRHIKDGIVENQRSKAHLIVALQEFLQEASRWHYFPSYEILMDELRDYRFYADDMLHPSSVAVEVVWSKFINAWMADQALPVMKKVEGVRKALEHKPFDPEGEAHKKFIDKVRKEIGALTAAYPFMRFE